MPWGSVSHYLSLSSLPVAPLPPPLPVAWPNKMHEVSKLVLNHITPIDLGEGEGLLMVLVLSIASRKRQTAEFMQKVEEKPSRKLSRIVVESCSDGNEGVRKRLERYFMEKTIVHEGLKQRII